MERTRYAFLIGAALAASAFVGIITQLNAAVGQTQGGVVPPNATGTTGGNLTGLGNETMLSSIPTPVNTTQLRMHIDEANSAVQANDTQGALTHIVLALEEIESILGGNVTTTANVTGTTMGNTTTL